VRLVIVAGPANSGKMPLARRLIADDPSLALVHRDDLRSALAAKLDEWHITLLMASLVRQLLSLGHNVIVCAWNLERADWNLWLGLATEHSAEMEWLDVREPDVAALIPPMETADGHHLV
jgi:predicted kinase